jgi:hypothetical protein
MAHGGRLPVHQPAAYHFASEMLADALMAKADAEQGLSSIRARRNEFKRNPRLRGSARPRRNQKRLRTSRQRLPRRNRVIADNFHLGPQLHQIMDEVPGEAVIIVDDEDHGLAIDFWNNIVEINPQSLSKSLPCFE